MAGPARAALPAAGPARTCSCAVLRQIGPVPNTCDMVPPKDVVACAVEGRRFRLAMCFGSPSVVALTFYYAQPG